MNQHEKNLQLERLVFFCDAIVAIAITLLALYIKIPEASSGHLQFSDFLQEWKAFAAFLLSFINIANFWKTHHSFFSHIRKIDERLLWFNISWLFFIVLLPFSTSLVSTYLFDTPAVLIYSLNVFMIAVFQNCIWDYCCKKDDFIKPDNIDEFHIWQFWVFCNLDMINALVAIVVSIFHPMLAFILLFTKLPLVLAVPLFYVKKKRKGF